MSHYNTVHRPGYYPVKEDGSIPYFTTAKQPKEEGEKTAWYNESVVGFSRWKLNETFEIRAEVRGVKATSRVEVRAANGATYTMRLEDFLLAVRCGAVRDGQIYGRFIVTRQVDKYMVVLVNYWEPHTRSWQKPKLHHEIFDR
jgi:hypothetical protein